MLPGPEDLGEAVAPIVGGLVRRGPGHGDRHTGLLVSPGAEQLMLGEGPTSYSHGGAAEALLGWPDMDQALPILP